MCTIGYCNKRYKNLNGLKYHIEHSHIAKLKQAPFANTISPLSQPPQQQQPPQNELWHLQQQFHQQ
ncbi:C2H2-type zinc finger transcription factor [Mucor lusitanicus CBS 277.49]|nr:C2H2-type zinc finger transcription factor [Mucor lusitanicus CBS 277.49]